MLKREFHIRFDLSFYLCNISRSLFIDHVTNIAKYVREEYRDIVPLIWDDMLRHIDISIIDEKFGSLVNIVVWDYAKEETTLPSWIWYHYNKIFKDNIWIASAFKGASGDTAMLPNLQMHYGNNLKWMKLVTSYKTDGNAKLIQFRGIFLTGWSRYSHFHVLCETLPVAIPSLLLNLVLVNTYWNHFLNNVSTENIHLTVSQKWSKLLGCPYYLRKEILDHFIEIESSDSINEYLSHRILLCYFDGVEVYEAISKLDKVERTEILPFILESSFSKNGFLQYNIDHKTVGNELIFDTAFQGSIYLTQMSHIIWKSMSMFFDEQTVEEFLEYKLNPLAKALDKIKQTNLQSKEHRVWPRRPFKHIAPLSFKDETYNDVSSLKTWPNFV